MTKFREQRTGFPLGEVDPLILARTDLKDYYNGAKVCRDWALLVQGGLMDRPGTRFIKDLGTIKGRLIEFVFADGQEYLIYLTNAAIKIVRDDGTDCVVTGAAPWATYAIPTLEFTSAGDTTIITHQDYGTMVLKRTGALTFTLSGFLFEEPTAGAPRRQPYFKFAPSNATLQPSGTGPAGTAITLTASADFSFNANHVNTIFRIKKKEVLITGIVDAQHANAQVREVLADTAATTEWEEQAFSPLRGYPRACAFHEDRLFLGGSRERPVAVWGSKTGAYFNFDLGTALDTDAIEKNLTFDRAKEIRHLVSADHLLVFTDGIELYAPKPTDKILTPANISFKPQSTYGSNAAKPRLLDGAALFVQRNGLTVRDFIYDDVQQKYLANGMSLRSAHLIRSPREMATLYGTDTRPEQYAFFVNNDGTLAVFHLVRAEKLAGWVPWRTDGKFVSVATTFDEAFVVVERVINGVTKYYLEKFDFSLTVDCAKTVDLGAAGTHFTGLDHLEGKTVSVVTANGALYMGDATVTGGAIDIDEPRQVCDIGLNFTPELETVPPDGALADGPMTTEMRRISAVTVMADSTVSFQVAGQNVWTRQVTDDMSQDPVPRTFTQRFPLLGYSRRPTVTLKRTVPVHCRIIGMTLEGDL